MRARGTPGTRRRDLTLDDSATLLSAQEDPVGLVCNERRACCSRSSGGGPGLGPPLRSDRVDESAITRDRTRFGPALERYVFGELLKLASESDRDYEVFTDRDTDQVEVDFVVENCASPVAGAEVKAGASVSRDDFGGLRRLAALAKDQFRRRAALRRHRDRAGW